MKAYPLLLISLPETDHPGGRSPVKERASRRSPRRRPPRRRSHLSEVTCRSALNAVKGMPSIDLKPYRVALTAALLFRTALSHAVRVGTGDEFSSVILVKTILSTCCDESSIDHLGNERMSPSAPQPRLSTNRRHYKLTRRSLEALANARTPVGLITKDRWSFAIRMFCSGVASRRLHRVLSVPTVDEEAWRISSPERPTTLQRLRAVRELNDAGIRAGVLMNPIVPGLTPSCEARSTIKAIAITCRLHGTMCVPKDGTRTNFMGFLEKIFPSCGGVPAALSRRLRSRGIF